MQMPPYLAQNLHCLLACMLCLPMYLNRHSGHGGHSGRYDSWRQHAFENAVILDALGATE